MIFTNDSGFPPAVSRAQLLYQELVLATVVVKASFQITAEGDVVPVASEAQLPVSEADVTTPIGTIDGDVVPIKPACDVALLGHARSPRADRPVDQVAVDLKIGSFSRSVTVFGDRVWAEAQRAHKPSAPVPFTSIPLTYERAYGGSAVVAKQLVAPYAQNPDGRGHVQLREKVTGTHLPNLEERDQLITSWEQTPLAAGTAPLPRTSSLRLDGGGFAVDLKNELLQLTPAAFSFAHPRMKIDSFPAGQMVSALGVTHAREPWRFTLPVLRFTAAVSLGSIRYELPLTVDTLCLFPDQGRFFAIARRACVYQMLAQRPRDITVFAGASSVSSPATTTIGEQRKASAPVVPIGPAAAPEALPLPFEALLPLYPLTNIVEALPLCPSG